MDSVYIMDVTQLKIESSIKEYANQVGFSHAGICRVEPGEMVPNLKEWLARNYHGEMRYMENPLRESPAKLIESISTVIVVGLNYRWAQGQDRPQEGMISKYAWASDYHEVMRPMLQQLAGFLRGVVPDAIVKTWVDTGPVVEKYWAQKAGIGWLGKHTNIISHKGSSWLFLGVLFTNLTLEPDPPAVDRCGTCSRCIEACPTRAIVAPYLLDSRLCISYLTIELRGSIPRHLRPMIGNRIFGCDDCQDVCPWNRFAFAGAPGFNPREEVFSATLNDYLRMTPAAFKDRFSGTNVLRAKYSGFIRNCLVAAGNSKKENLRDAICFHLHSENEMIREHAVWAIAQYRDSEALKALQDLQQGETSQSVLDEIQHWLSV